jgi:hypothetical protein
VDGGEKFGDGGLGWVGDGAVTFACWWMVALRACGRTRGGEGRVRGVVSSGRGRVVRWVLAVSYIPVQCSPDVFWGS